MKVPVAIAYLVLMLITLPFQPAYAQDKPKTSAGKPNGNFDLKDGDRVVLLGK